jgi:hypothetical protein
MVQELYTLYCRFSKGEYLVQSQLATTDGPVEFILQNTEQLSVHDSVEQKRKANPHILQLPDESLDNILELAVATTEKYSLTKRYTTALVLSVVCKRFGRLARPLLYHTISFDADPSAEKWSLVPPTLAATQLHSVMKNNPTCRFLCKELNINLANLNKDRLEDYDLAKELLPWLTNVRTFSITSGFDDRIYIWPILYTVFRHMTLITRLHIECWGGLLFIASICLIDLPKLKSLSLVGIYIPNTFEITEGNKVS